MHLWTPHRHELRPYVMNPVAFDLLVGGPAARYLPFMERKLCVVLDGLSTNVEESSMYTELLKHGLAEYSVGLGSAYKTQAILLRAFTKRQKQTSCQNTSVPQWHIRHI